MFSVYLHSGYPVQPQNSPNLPFLFLRKFPHLGRTFSDLALSEGFSISLCRNSNTF